MSSTIAIMIVAIIYLAALTPLALVARKPRALVLSASLYGLLIGGVAIAQSGLFASAAIPSLTDVSLGDRPLSESQCDQVLTLLDNGGVFIERRTPSHVIVVQQAWDQLPPEARDTIISCVQHTWPRNAAPAQVEVRP